MNKENAKQNIATTMSSTIGAAVGVVAGTMATGEMQAAEASTADEATVTEAEPADGQQDGEDVPVVDSEPSTAPEMTAEQQDEVVAQPENEPTAQPTAQTSGDVQVLDYQTVQMADGNMADVAVISNGTNQAVIIDADRDGIADVMAADTNHDGQLSENEIVDISGENLAMQQLQDAAHASSPSGDGYVMAQNTGGEPDYVNDANVDGFVNA